MSDSTDLLKARRIAREAIYGEEFQKNKKGQWSREGLTVYALSETSGGYLNRWTAQVSGGYQGNGKRTPWEEMAAVAVLIEAAPELLAACIDLLKHASLTDHMSAYSVEQAQKAVAKAEGRAH